MNVSEHVAAAENAIRDLIARRFAILNKELNADELGVTQGRFDLWSERRTAESKKRDGLRHEPRILYYADITDLAAIIGKNWSDFKPCFDDKKKFDVYMGRLAELRDPNAHSRELAPFESQLIMGISGEIRQAITVYFSIMGDEPEFFPRIERIQDSFGNSNGSLSAGTWSPDTHLTLRPGDEITFVADAWDPQGEDVDWSIAVGNGPIQENVQVGLRFEYSWTVSDRDIGDPINVLVGITSRRAFHKREAGIGRDSSTMLTYRVLPSSL